MIDAMHRVDLSASADLPILLEMLRDASTRRRPEEMLRAFGQHLWRVRPVDRVVTVSVRALNPGEYKVTRVIDRGAHAVDPDNPPNPWRDWDRLETHTGGFIGSIIARPEPQLLHDLRVADDPALGDAVADMRCCMASPLFDDGRVLNWNLYLCADPRGYTPRDLADHLVTTNLVGTATRNLVAVNRAEELNRALQRQLEAVARVQQALLPAQIPRIPFTRIATSYLTSDEAGGDYYDFLGLPGGGWGILIADVAGHGAAAATVMAMLHAILHGYEGPDFSPASVIRYANRRLATSLIENSFVTAFFGVYDPSTGSLAFARAGHNPPRLKRGGTGEIIALDGGAALPLGITLDHPVEQDRVVLEPHDTLVLYTDGITEAFGPGREMFGVDRLDRTLEACSGEPDCVVESVHAALYEHTRARTRDDDQTIVALRRTPER